MSICNSKSWCSSKSRCNIPNRYPVNHKPKEVELQKHTLKVAPILNSKWLPACGHTTINQSCLEVYKQTNKQTEIILPTQPKVIDAMRIYGRESKKEKGLLIRRFTRAKHAFFMSSTRIT